MWAQEIVLLFMGYNGYKFDTLLIVPLYEITITDRVVSTVASNFISCFTITLTAMNNDSCNLFKPDATLLLY